MEEVKERGDDPVAEPGGSGRKRRLPARAALALLAALVAGIGAAAERQMERLGRGVVAVPCGGGQVFVGWRLLGTDPDQVAFNLYRSAGGGPPVKVNDAPLAESTSFLDVGVDPARTAAYFVRPVLRGEEGEASASFVRPAGAPVRPCLSVPLDTPEGYAPNDASVGDLDGDGEYEIVVHQAGRGRDNSQRGPTDEPILEAYGLEGRRWWRIRLGRNIREGAHYTQFLVYDLDGDGKAEVAMKTADGTIDGTGVAIGDPRADHRDRNGYVLTGPEFLTAFEAPSGSLPPSSPSSASGPSDFPDVRKPPSRMNGRSRSAVLTIASPVGARPRSGSNSRAFPTRLRASRYFHLSTVPAAPLEGRADGGR